MVQSFVSTSVDMNDIGESLLRGDDGNGKALHHSVDFDKDAGKNSDLKSSTNQM